jgi:hypothetical protein
MSFCTTCGNKLDNPAQRFCIKCGSKITAAPAPVSQPVTSPVVNPSSPLGTRSPSGSLTGTLRGMQDLSQDEVIQKLVKGVKDYKEKFTAEEERANQLEQKLKTIVIAVKDERENKKKVRLYVA